MLYSAWNTTNGRKIFFRLWLQDPSSVPPVKLYNRKELIIMETYINDFHTSFYIQKIQNLEFHLPHVRILGNHHCGNTRRKALKHHR